MKNCKLKLVDSKNLYGTMNSKSVNLNNITDYDFDWYKMFMANQKTKDGSYFEITNDYLEANPDGWSDISEDILIVTDKTPGVVIGHPVADCPVIVMEDKRKGVTAMAHCSADLIDKKMPMMIADTIINPEYYSNSASSPYGLNDQSKFERNFIGAFYQENVKIKK